MATLARNPTDRRVFVSAWDPSEDGLGAVDQKNVPCPVGFTLSIVEGRLNSSLLIRSSDVFVGLPYDAMGHALLMNAVASSLGVPLGFMQISVAHPHIYDSHYDMALTALNGPVVKTRVALPCWKVQEIVDSPDDYVRVVHHVAAAVSWNDFCPRPEVVA
jgi:thymidylate synthase